MRSWGWKLRRAVKHWWQRRTRGWDDSDLWNLDNTLARMIHPRLKAFSASPSGHPADMTEDVWQEELAAMTRAFEILAADDGMHSDDPAIEYGLHLFARRYRALWN